MIAVPNYMKPYADNVKIKKENVAFSLKCSCGCESFRLMQNVYTDEENRQIAECERINNKRVGWHSIYGGLDKDGKPYQYIKFLGIFKKNIEWEPQPLCANIKVVKAKCISCGNEIVVFDSRFHGYDSMDTKKEEIAYVAQFDENNKVNECYVEVMIEQNEETDDANLFSSIMIYAKRNGKRQQFFEMETA